MTKNEIRQLIKRQKAKLSDVEKLVSASKVFASLEKCNSFINAHNILLYYSLPDELLTHKFIAKWYGKKNIFLPRVNGEYLDILPYDPSTLHFGAYNIVEPKGNNITDPCKIELIIVPAIAFDRKGNRIGRGKGYYDRLLPNTTATKIGVGYDFQLIDNIETEPHDITMDIVITESNIISIPESNKQ